MIQTPWRRVPTCIPSAKAPLHKAHKGRLLLTLLLMLLTTATAGALPSLGTPSLQVVVETQNGADGKVSFKGTYSPIVWNTENKSILFVGENNTLYYPKSGAFVNACRAYFELSDDSQAREFVMNFDGEATGISDALRLNDKGQMTNDNFYDLQGRKIEKPTKGLYIHNGKKVIIK